MRRFLRAFVTGELRASTVLQGSRFMNKSILCFLLIATIVITVNLLVDLLYGVINPRIGHG